MSVICILRNACRERLMRRVGINFPSLYPHFLRGVDAGEKHVSEKPLVVVRGVAVT